jgi:hypothetical protein
MVAKAGYSYRGVAIRSVGRGTIPEVVGFARAASNLAWSGRIAADGRPNVALRHMTVLGMGEDAAARRLRSSGRSKSVVTAPVSTAPNAVESIDRVKRREVLGPPRRRRDPP